MRNPAHAQFWRAEAASIPVVQIPFREVFTTEEFATICRGLVPRSMDEKWFVLYERPTLLLYRSWTGRLIYRVRFDEGLDDARAVDATVLDNAEFYRRGSVDDEAELLSYVLRGLMLNQDVPFPQRGGQFPPQR
jgi:hypothetical protein